MTRYMTTRKGYRKKTAKVPTVSTNVTVGTFTYGKASNRLSDIFFILSPEAVLFDCRADRLSVCQRSNGLLQDKTADKMQEGKPSCCRSLCAGKQTRPEYPIRDRRSYRQRCNIRITIFPIKHLGESIIMLTFAGTYLQTNI